jgi:hypothetical protein
MAQIGYTPIQIYYSSTTTNAPVAGNLAYGELAINITDGKLFYKDNANAIQVIGYKLWPMTSVTGTLAIANGGTNATTASGARTSLGATTVGSNFFTLTNPSAVTYLQVNADNTITTMNAATFRSAIGAGTGSGSVTSVGGTGTVNGITLTGTVTSSGNLTLGGTLSGVSLTTQVTGTLPVANGGTNLTSYTANGIVYASGIGTLATSSSFTYDGTNFAVGGYIRGASVTITGAAGGTITPTSGTTNQYTVTALGAAATFAIPSGTPIDGQKLTLRIKDNGTARGLTWTTSAGGYRVVGSVLPTTTVANKTIYVGCIYNSADSYWDVVAVTQEV